jgi:EAL domain-containing protein (putative c-di-GMP-specific phosphodiesterase class I)
VNDVRERVERLRALGFRIAIDDLGAGQADSSTFAQLEPEFVKIDASIIRGVDRDPSKRKMVQALVHLCHNMDKMVIAEGVENAAERDTLAEAGCDFLQGSFLGAPAPFQERQRTPA